MRLAHVAASSPFFKSNYLWSELTVVLECVIITSNFNIRCSLFCSSLYILFEAKISLPTFFLVKKVDNVKCPVDIWARLRGGSQKDAPNTHALTAPASLTGLRASSLAGRDGECPVCRQAGEYPTTNDQVTSLKIESWAFDIGHCEAGFRTFASST